MPQLAIAWTLRNPFVSTVLLGGTKVAHIEENSKVFSVVSKLTPQILGRIDDILSQEGSGEGAAGATQAGHGVLPAAVRDAADPNGGDATGRLSMPNFQL